MYEHFDVQLLDHIKNFRHDDAKAMLNEELAQAFVDSDVHGTLLHVAVEHKNAVIARRLIELGADVDRFSGQGTTPLRTALILESAAVVQVLLEADARLDIVDGRGISALRLALDRIHVDSDIFKLLAGKLRKEANTNEELADRLIAAGCNLCHAVKFGDIDLMEYMLKREVDVNSKDFIRCTALNVAVKLKDVKLADWLLKKGIDVDALDEDGSSALAVSAEGGDKAMVQLLLEHDACPDGDINDYTPLYAAFLNMDKEYDVYVECADLLLQHGAHFPNSEKLLRMFKFALYRSSDNRSVKWLIARVAMLEKLGEPVDKSIMYSVRGRYQAKMSELRKYYESCQQVLAIKVFEKLSLLDLLNGSNRKMRLMARKKTFFQEVRKVSSEHKLSELYSIYHNAMMRRIEKAKRVVTLEDEAILVICKIFEVNYNHFYDLARGVVEYLNERDLENLVQV